VDDGTRTGSPKPLPRRREARGARPGDDAAVVDVQFGNLVSAARLVRRLTMTQVSKDLDITPRRYSAIEAGTTSCTVAELSKLKRLLDLVWPSIERIIDGGSPPLPGRYLVTEEVLDIRNAAEARLRDMGPLSAPLRAQLDGFDALVAMATPRRAPWDVTAVESDAEPSPDGSAPGATTA